MVYINGTQISAVTRKSRSKSMGFCFLGGFYMSSLVGCWSCAKSHIYFVADIDPANPHFFSEKPWSLIQSSNCFGKLSTHTLPSIENGHLYWVFPLIAWWFSIVFVNVDQRVESNSNPTKGNLRNQNYQHNLWRTSMSNTLVGGFNPLKNMSSSMGRIIPYMKWKTKNVPNHQPALDLAALISGFAVKLRKLERLLDVGTVPNQVMSNIANWKITVETIGQSSGHKSYFAWAIGHSYVKSPESICYIHLKPEKMLGYGYTSGIFKIWGCTPAQSQLIIHQPELIRG